MRSYSAGALTAKGFTSWATALARSPSPENART
jgi:hypothetical protein